LTTAGTLIIYDDRDERAGEKLADADLMGIPYRWVISDKTLSNNSVEIKQRGEDTVKLIEQKFAIKTLDKI
jgi:prolyl-tRNA synthetase